MSENFCGGCNRLRLTADGNLKICLFDNRELNLKELLNTCSDDEIIQAIEDQVQKKHFKHGGISGGAEGIVLSENRNMTTIGG
jgi:molybdenum cofactor biosynthesis enzyme MoaA